MYKYVSSASTKTSIGIRLRGFSVRSFQLMNSEQFFFFSNHPYDNGYLKNVKHIGLVLVATVTVLCLISGNKCQNISIRLFFASTVN